MARLLTPKTRQVLIAFRIFSVNIFSGLQIAYRMQEKYSQKCALFRAAQGAQLTAASDLPPNIISVIKKDKSGELRPRGKDRFGFGTVRGVTTRSWFKYSVYKKILIIGVKRTHGLRALLIFFRPRSRKKNIKLRARFSKTFRQPSPPPVCE